MKTALIVILLLILAVLVAYILHKTGVLLPHTKLKPW